MSLDLDLELRLAVFDHVQRLAASGGGLVPAQALNAGLIFRGERVPIWNQQKGIFRPAMLRDPGAALTIQTSFDGPYDDRHDVSEDQLLYRYRGTEPLHPDNVAVRRAMELGRPLLYLVAVSPGVYHPVFPCYVVGDAPAQLAFHLMADARRDPSAATEDPGLNIPLKAYATRVVKQRLHQERFRYLVLTAYRRQCAMCRLRHAPLLDAAHILPDREERGVPEWNLASRRRAPWRWISPPGLVVERGTAVRLRLENPLSALLDAGFIEAAVRRHFEPLLDRRFEEILVGHYPGGVGIAVNGLPMSTREPSPGWAPLAIRIGRKRKPSAQGYLERYDAPLPEDLRGVALSTFGKVIKRGWDWLALSPAGADRVTGLIEAPELAESLTLSKADFGRTGARGAKYLAYRKVLQEAVSAQLALWGDNVETPADSRRRHTRPIERDLESVLVELARTFPLLASLVDHRPGGQKRLPLGGTPASVADPPVRELHEIRETPPDQQPAVPELRGNIPNAAPSASPAPEAELAPGPLPGGRGPRRAARYGLRIQFERRPDDSALSRLAESTVWVNEAHPAYGRAVASRSEAYHLALSVGMALAPLAVDPAETHGFVTAFLARWGEATVRPRGQRKR